MTLSHHNSKNIKLVVFLFAFWTIGIILAFFWGLGWFFLMESLRRLLTYIPSIRQHIKKIVVGKEMAGSLPIHPTNPNKIILSRYFRVLVLCAWISMTIFIFIYMNIPLAKIFYPSRL